MEIAMGRKRHRSQTRPPHCQFDLFEAEPPTGPAPTPNWSTLPAETQRKLIGLMARLFADRAGGRADESRESANDL
ncbi:MAG TPA: hypothetical protein VLJ13_01110 [Brevundimonas sp.]|nr:hypothetical protein [Brevundimonas sp.]